MLKNYEWTQKEDKEAVKAGIKALRATLMGQQQRLRDAKLPVIVLIEGWAAAGKGSLIKELISEIDPRFYSVESPTVTPEAQERYPFLYQYVKAIPQNGKITFLAACGKDAVGKGIKAGDIIKSVTAICGGKGGGKPDSAMGGGTDVLKLDDALASVDDFVHGKLGE